MMFRKKTIERLSEDLSLPFTGTEQDWDIEMANSDRVNEFIEFYKHNDLSEDEKVAIMSLILASYDELLNKNNLEIDDNWGAIKSILISAKLIFADVLDYWSLGSESNDGDVFRITPLIRKIIPSSAGLRPLRDPPTSGLKS